MDTDKWQRLIAGTDCPVCLDPPGGDSPAEFASRGVVATLPSGRVVLQDDADFPGYCILYHRRHVTELFELSDDERRQWVEDAASLARAIQAVCSPAKLNYAVLGNLVPHWHVHVIPRRPGDGYWGKPIWSRADEARRRMTREEFESTRRALAERLALPVPK